MTFCNILQIFVIVLTATTFSLSMAADSPFDALRGLNLPRQDEKKDETAKPGTTAPQSEAEKKTEELVVKKTRPALENAAKADAKTTQRVESATWSLLTGEWLFKDAKESTLWSATITSLHKGKTDIEQLEREIEADEEKRKELFTNENLAIRYDIARTRRDTLEQKEQLARNEEIDRLHQLRQIILAYTELTKKMSEADEYRHLGNLSKSVDALDESIQHIGKIKEIADSRKDYYLFKDEPKVEGDEEFTLVKVISPVFSQQLIVHLKTLHSATLFRLAVLLQDKEVGSQLLDDAIKTAQDTLKESDKDNSVVKNPLLPYILGEAFLVKGLRITEIDPTLDTKHKEASPFFNDAITHLEMAASLLEEPDAKNVSELKNMIKRKWDYLKHPLSFIDEAQSALLNGENTRAFDLLQTATLFHRDSVVWGYLLETAARVNLTKHDLTKILKDGENVIAKDDLSGQTAIGRAVLALIEPQITGTTLPATEKQILFTQLESVAKAIDDLNPVNEQNELISGKATAILSKLLTLQELLVNDDIKNEIRGRESVRIAENSLASLSGKTNNLFETFLQHEYKAIAYFYCIEIAFGFVKYGTYLDIRGSNQRFFIACFVRFNH